MRILANYGMKTNGDSYTVTFETTGDVPAEKAPATVDELFRLAKEAIQRQVEAGAPVAHPTVTHTEGAPFNGNGNGNGRKPAAKDPSRPATPKQVRLLRQLSKETGCWVEGIENLTIGEASGKIDELMAQRV